MPFYFLRYYLAANFFLSSGFSICPSRIWDLTAVSSNTEGSYHQIGGWSENREIEESQQSDLPSPYNFTYNDGLVMLVINEHSKQVLLQKVFPTWNAFTFSTDLMWWLSRVQKRRIIVLYVKKSGIHGLNQAMNYFKRRGSYFIALLPANSLWIWIWVVGGKTLVEVASPVRNEFNLRKIISNVNYEIPSHSELVYKSPIDKIISAYCETTEGMGDLCSNEISAWYPNHNSLLSWSNNERRTTHLNNRNLSFGVIVCAGNRPQYLFETLKSLLRCRKVKKENIFVVVSRSFISGEPDGSTLRLLGLLMIPYQVAAMNPKIKAKNPNYQNFFFYKEAWKRSLSAFSEAQYIAFIDEDVVVHKDWMRFLLHSASALDIDSTLWCVTGTAAFPTGGTEGRLMRGWRQVGWGYLIRWQEVSDAVRLWPDQPNYSPLYDAWLLKTVAKFRDCIYPEISYSHHFGVGVNTEPFLHERYFITEDFSTKTTKKFSPVRDLIKNKYFNDIWYAIANAIPLKSEPCEDGFFDISNQSSGLSRDYVFYFYLHDIWEAPTWTFVAECIGAWPYSTHGMFEGVLKYPVKKGSFYIYFVGTPFSPYSVLKPKDYRTWQVPKEDSYLEKQISFTSKFAQLPNFKNRSLDNLEEIFFH